MFGMPVREALDQPFSSTRPAKVCGYLFMCVLLSCSFPKGGWRSWAAPIVAAGWSAVPCALVGLLLVALVWGLLKQVKWAWLHWSWLSLWGAETCNINVKPMTYGKWSAVPYMLILAAALPSICAWEEGVFRAGTSGWLNAAWRSAAFGLVHWTAGCPLSACAAIGTVGLWFSYLYMSAGLVQCVATHIAYNGIVLCCVFAGVLAKGKAGGTAAGATDGLEA